MPSASAGAAAAAAGAGSRATWRGCSCSWRACASAGGVGTPGCSGGPGRTRGWTPEEVDGALARLRDRGVIEGEAFTGKGEELRAAIEEATDQAEAKLVDALGDDAEELFSILDPWATAIIESGGYPADPRQMTRP